MRVALITDGIWPYVLGGMQKHSYYLCKYLAQNKVQVDLYHFNSSAYDIAKLEFFSAEERLYIHSHIVSFPTAKGFPGAYIYNSYKHSELIYKAIAPQLGQYDLIYTKGFTGWKLIAEKHKGNISCAPVGVKFHGYEMFQEAPALKTWLQHVLLLRWPVRRISRQADIVFSYGGKITEIIQSIGVKPGRIFELPSGVESSFLATGIKPCGDRIKFLFLGRYERRKGIEELNTASRQLAEGAMQARCEFHFIGPIPAEKRVSGPAHIYHGEVRDKAQLQHLITACDVLLCPSWSEGLPNSILEALASGLTVMATDVGAVNVVVNNDTGWLIPDSDPATLKSTLESIISAGPAEIDRRKKSALALMQSRFTWETLITRFCDHFLKLKP